MPSTHRFAHTTLPAAAAVLGVFALGASACGSLTDANENSGLPSGVSDPGTYKTTAGAQNMYRRAVYQFEQAFLEAARAGGVLTDELQGLAIDVDQRELPDGRPTSLDAAYGALQTVRAYQVQAAGALAKYDTVAPPALRGHAYAMGGYAEVLLADLYCAGVPLSELEFEGDFTYKAGSNTADVYRHAVAMFDSAIALSADSARILNFARVGKGRALLALGEYAAAAQAVAAVPDAYQYSFPVLWANALGTIMPAQRTLVEIDLLGSASVADSEGRVGLPYRSGGDPRTAASLVDISNVNPAYVVLRYFPAKYGAPAFDSGGNGNAMRWQSVAPAVVASGVEARLIEAEVALQAGKVSAWLAALDRLRTDGSFSVSGTDTTWNAGTGGVAGLRPLTDPGTAAARVDLTFRERAFWLFADGHRQGDLRRLMRQYQRTQSQVYPNGAFTALDGNPATLGHSPAYGTHVNLPIPQTEGPNPLFTGCLNRNP